MTSAKIIYWIAVISFGYYSLKMVIFFLRLGASIGDSLAISLWLFLWWMLFRRPRSWGLGVGIFMLFAIAVQTVLWRFTVTSPKKEELGISDSWTSFGLSVLPLLVAGVCSISLRWLLPSEPNQSPVPARGNGK